jgi:hypothetical protein
MSCFVPPPPKPRIATLGRDAWGLLHATADALENTRAELLEFVLLAQLIVHLYPCDDCHENAERKCSAFLAPDGAHALDTLAGRARLRGGAFRVVAVAWAARFHACVTAHATTASEASKALATCVRAFGDDDDEELAAFITSSRDAS